MTFDTLSIRGTEKKKRRDSAEAATNNIEERRCGEARRRYGKVQIAGSGIGRSN